MPASRGAGFSRRLTAAAGTLGGRRRRVAEVGSGLGRTGGDRAGRCWDSKRVAVSTADTVVVPKGYTAEVLIAWGDPVGNGPEFEQDASNCAEDQARQWGMHNDGLVYFPINGSWHGLLAQNNEYADEGLLFPDGVANWDEEKTKKSSNAHGVSIIEIKKDGQRQITASPRWRKRWSKGRATGASCVNRASRAASPARRR